MIIISKKSTELTLLLITVFFMFLVCGCAKNANGGAGDAGSKVEITVFAAKSLNAPLDEIIDIYLKANPLVEIRANYDSSGTLLTQITEGGAACDIFFSAAEKQVDILEQKGLTVSGTRTNLLRNQMCVVTYRGSNTRVKGLSDINKASSLAIANESVPIGMYTRKALINSGIINLSDEDNITSKDISDALGGVKINECSNAGAVVAALTEHSNEVGTVYYSDISGLEDKLQVLEVMSTEKTGDIIYPAVQIINDEADDLQKAEAKKFLDFLGSDEANAVFKKYQYIVPSEM